jgi:hypothetical protein
MRKVRAPIWAWLILFWIWVAIVRAQAASHTIIIRIIKLPAQKGGVAGVVADSLFRKGIDLSDKKIVVTLNDSTATLRDSVATIIAK